MPTFDWETFLNDDGAKSDTGLDLAQQAIGVTWENVRRVALQHAIVLPSELYEAILLFGDVLRIYGIAQYRDFCKERQAGRESC